MGSLISLWVAEQTSETHLWLLGRWAYALDLWTARNSLVTLARRDVYVGKEAALVVRAAGQYEGLQVSQSSPCRLCHHGIFCPPKSGNGTLALGTGQRRGLRVLPCPSPAGGVDPLSFIGRAALYLSGPQLQLPRR